MIKLRNILNEYSAMNKMSDYKKKEKPKPLEEFSASGLGLSDNDIKDFLTDFRDWWNHDPKEAEDEKEKERQEKVKDLKSKFGDPVEAAEKMVKDPEHREFVKKEADKMTPEQKEESRKKAKDKGDPIQKMANAKFKSDSKKSKSPVAKSLRKRGFDRSHQKAAKKYGDWTKTESLQAIKAIIVEEVREALSSTERMRRYNKRHPEKVKQNLKKTQNDRVKRNKAHNDKTEELGTELMRNKDVHHPNGVNGNGAKVVNGDHGRDIKK